MSRTLFLVAYRALYRHNSYALPPRLPDRMFLKGFSERARAEAFLADLPLPYHINPFDGANIFVSVHGTLCTFRVQDSAELPLTAFCTWVASLGGSPPAVVLSASPHWNYTEMDAANQVLHAWWEEQLPGMTEALKQAIWSWCDPKPYEIVEVELEGSIG